MQGAAIRKPGELGFALLLCVFSLWLLTQAYSISGFSSLSSAGFFPMAGALAMSGASLVILAGVLRKQSVGSARQVYLHRLFSEILPPVVVIFSAIVIAYMLLLEPLGFLISSFLFLLASMLYLDRSKLLHALIISALSLAAIYGVFEYVFSVLLPKGSLLQ